MVQAPSSASANIWHAVGLLIATGSLAVTDVDVSDVLTGTATLLHMRDGDLAELAGQPIRLRFVLRDADLYSLQFNE